MEQDAQRVTAAILQVVNTSHYFTQISTQAKGNCISQIELDVKDDTSAITKIKELSALKHDLNSNLALRLYVIKITNSAKRFLFLNIHHILLDGIGLTAFIDAINNHLEMDENKIFLGSATAQEFSQVDADLLAAYSNQLENAITCI
jgi:hypothetical protein